MDERRGLEPPQTPWLWLAVLAVATVPVLLLGLVLFGGALREGPDTQETSGWTFVAILWLVQGVVAYCMMRRRAVGAGRSAVLAAALLPVTFLTLAVAIRLPYL